MWLTSRSHLELLYPPHSFPCNLKPGWKGILRRKVATVPKHYQRRSLPDKPDDRKSPSKQQQLNQKAPSKRSYHVLQTPEQRAASRKQQGATRKARYSKEQLQAWASLGAKKGISKMNANQRIARSKSAAVTTRARYPKEQRAKWGRGFGSHALVDLTREQRSERSKKAVATRRARNPQWGKGFNIHSMLNLTREQRIARAKKGAATRRARYPKGQKKAVGLSKVNRRPVQRKSGIFRSPLRGPPSGQVPTQQPSSLHTSTGLSELETMERLFPPDSN